MFARYDNHELVVIIKKLFDFFNINAASLPLINLVCLEMSSFRGQCHVNQALVLKIIDSNKILR